MTGHDLNDFSPVERFMPEGATPVQAVIALEYLDAEGEVCYGWARLGSLSSVEAMKILKYAELQLAAPIIGVGLQRQAEED